MTWYADLAETNRLPDWVLRAGIRAGLAHSNRQRYRRSLEERQADRQALLEKLRQSPIAIHTNLPNQQHYEVPAEFFQLVLGKRLKYSCCYWPDGVDRLDRAEEAMLHLTCERAQLEDGMDILELGCGWGSFCLWAAKHYPNSRILAMSNSRLQKAYIEGQIKERGLGNVHVLHADMRDFDTSRDFDRVVSIEMFEHMKNYERLLARIASFLRPTGQLFVHIFSHRKFAYEFDAADPEDWMAQHFFTGGTMPSDDLLLDFQRDLQVVDHWQINGRHYTRTLRAWLNNLDRNEAAIRPILRRVYGSDNETRWLARWRLFFIGCEETFRMRQGREYRVSHYLFAKPGNA